MALFAKDELSIYNESIDYLVNNTNLTSTGPGSRVRIFAEVLKNEMAQSYRVFDLNTGLGFIHGAAGVFLDYLGDLFGLNRITSSTATAGSGSDTVRFYTVSGNFGAINNNANIQIPANTRIWAQLGGLSIYYQTTLATTLLAGTNTGTVSVRAVAEGSRSNVPANTIIYHGFTNYASFKTAPLFVTNTQAIDSGSDGESDKNFRDRILHAFQSMVSGNQTAITTAANNVQGVVNCDLRTNHFGTGHGLLLVETTTTIPSTSVLANVQMAVDEVVSSGLQVTVQGPDLIEVSFVIKASTQPNANKDAVKAAITRALTDYINNLSLGTGFSLSRAAIIAMQSSADIIGIGSGSRFFERVFLTYISSAHTIVKDVVNEFTPEFFEKLIIASTTPVTIEIP